MKRLPAAVVPNPINACSAAPRYYADSQLADTAAFDAALIHLSLGPDEQVGTLMLGFNKCINVTPESLTDVKDAPCRDLSPRWKTANRGVNNLSGTRSMSKIAGLAMEAFTYPPCVVLFKASEKCYACGGLAAHLFDGKELCYVASEARFEGEASK
jgi:hypothetical protein